LALPLVLPAVSAVAPPSDPTITAHGDIPPAQLELYSRRSAGALGFHIDHASHDYLGSPPAGDTPFKLSRLRQAGSAAAVRHSSHRTMVADSTAANRYFGNIQARTPESGVWKVLGGMARLAAK